MKLKHPTLEMNFKLFLNFLLSILLDETLI